MTAALKIGYETPRPASLEARARTLDAAAQSMTARGILESALSEFGSRLALVSSFGAESAALLHLAASVDPAIPVLFLDTGKHFVQTHAYRDELVERLGLKNVQSIFPDREETMQEDAKGDLWKRDNDSCCALRKVRPLGRALAGYDAWITGRKRMHGSLRTHLPLIEFSAPHVKINPLARWSLSEVADYMARHELPTHPLVATGFSSIGCWPCTAPTAAGDDPRAGRWRGLAKTECGIHRI